MFQLVLQQVWFQAVSFMRAHGQTAHAAVKGWFNSTRSDVCRSACVRSCTSGSTGKAGRGKACHSLLIHQVAVV